MTNFTNSDLIGIAAIIIAILIGLITIYFSQKYKPSSLSQLEIKAVDKLIDKILKINYSITYYTYIKKLELRRAFTISGDSVSLSEKIESKIEKHAMNYPLIACRDYIETDYFKDFYDNRLLSKGLRDTMKKLILNFEDEEKSETDLIEANYNFALLDQNNPVQIFMSIGIIPYRRISIRKGNYSFLTYQGKRMKAIDLKNAIKDIDKELIKWLNITGKKHMYEKKKKTIIPNDEIKKILIDLRDKIDKNISIDIFRVDSDSELAKEIESLMKNQ